jgi:hypothetical protein|tara:strand:+ start:46 stop:252 length:207 start_codon:yes stop_codon:yes gene_type:complete
MARASNTYLVISDGIPVAGFTVKYEMESWIHSEWCPVGVLVYRIEEVGRYHRKPKITEITNKYYGDSK